MSDIKSQSQRPAPPAATGTLGNRPSREGSSGRVAFNPDGDAVWELKTETGHFSREVNTTLLQKLEAPELSIEKTVVVEQLKDPSPQGPALPGGGYNPYDRSTVKPVAEVARVARKPAVARSPEWPARK
jgi:hypothetical protein